MTSPYLVTTVLDVAQAEWGTTLRTPSAVWGDRSVDDLSVKLADNEALIVFHTNTVSKIAVASFLCNLSVAPNSRIVLSFALYGGHPVWASGTLQKFIDRKIRFQVEYR
jgi:hypothetical protein